MDWTNGIHNFSHDIGLKGEALDPRGQRSMMFELDIGKENADNDDHTGW